MDTKDMSKLKPGDKVTIEGHEGEFEVIAVEGFNPTEPRVIIQRHPSEGQTHFGIDSADKVTKVGATAYVAPTGEPQFPEPEPTEGAKEEPVKGRNPFKRATEDSEDEESKSKGTTAKKK